MRNNPLHVAVFQGYGENQRKTAENIFVALFNALPGVTFLAWMNGQIVGAMRMKSCDDRNGSDRQPQTDDADNLHWRISHWHNQWARHDPSHQHWHLGPIGVLPAHQGKVIGAQLLRRFCREVDPCSSPAYLETDTDSNARFYQRFVFVVVKETIIFDVKNRYMSRPAATGVR
jgi:GNAT superfamily N-acetyltransferase